MRPPPPVSQFHRYPVSAGIAILAMAVTVASWGKLDISPLYATAMIRRGEFWRLLTSILPHVGIWHLIFNIYWLWVFGTLMEEVYGHFKTAALIVLFAVGSSALEFAFLTGGVGLSGVGYGLFGLLWILSSRDQRFYDAVDARTIQLFVFWFFLCIGMTLTNLMPVANIAHGAGALLGILAGFAITQPRPRSALAITAIVAILSFSLWASTSGRPRINLSSRTGYDEGDWGYEALQSNHNQEAVHWLRDAIAYRHDSSAFWWDLGIAYMRVGSQNEAIKAYRKAADLGEVSAQSFMGAMYAGGGGGLPKDPAQAFYWYRKAAEHGDASGQYSLGQMYEYGTESTPKDPVQALLWFRRAADQGDAQAQNNVAWTLATSSDPAIRNPKAALEYAAKAVASEKGEPDPNHLDTLAEAHYVNQQYEDAVKVEEQAIAAAASLPTEEKASFEKSLEKYQAALKASPRAKTPREK